MLNTIYEDDLQIIVYELSKQRCTARPSGWSIRFRQAHRMAPGKIRYSPYVDGSLLVWSPRRIGATGPRLLHKSVSHREGAG